MGWVGVTIMSLPDGAPSVVASARLTTEECRMRASLFAEIRPTLDENVAGLSHTAPDY